MKGCDPYMEIMFAVGILIVAVIAAEIIYQQFSAIPLAFYQIGAGALLSLTTLYHHYQFDPEFFLLAIIAPIMFNDAQETSRKTLSRNIMDTLSLAIMLVITTVLIVGFGVHLIYPALTLSLAFLLIAIVTPTDATAVSSVTQNLQLPTGLMDTLKNESLFNDASGIVAFDLALTAFMSGDFSVSHGVIFFLETFFGGLLIGAFLGWLITALRIALIRWNIESASIAVPVQLLTPFVIYWVAEELHVSGILAVVAAGLIHGIERDNLRLTSTKIQVVSTSVWGLLTSLLNGFVFVLLGVSLPTIIDNLLAKHQISILILTALAIGIYALMMGIRFLWIRQFIRLPFGKSVNLSAALLSLSGVHGTVTLAMAFSLPLTLTNGTTFPMRNELIFIAAIIILLSLIVPLFTIPFILPAQQSEDQDDFDTAHHAMLDYAIAWLKNNATESNARHQVIETLAFEKGLRTRPDRKQVDALFKMATQTEVAAVNQRINSGELTNFEQTLYQRYVFMLTSRQASPTGHTRIGLRTKYILAKLIHPFKRYKMRKKAHQIYQQADLRQRESSQRSTSDQQVAVTRTNEQQPISQSLITAVNEQPLATLNQSRQIMINVEQLGNQAVMTWLKNQQVSSDQAAINFVRDTYIKRSRRFKRDDDKADDEMLNALYLAAFQAEYQFVQDALSRDKLSTSLAKSLREQVSYDQMVYMQNDNL